MDLIAGRDSGFWIQSFHLIDEETARETSSFFQSLSEQALAPDRLRPRGADRGLEVLLPSLWGPRDWGGRFSPSTVPALSSVQMRAFKALLKPNVENLFRSTENHICLASDPQELQKSPLLCPPIMVIKLLEKSNLKEKAVPPDDGRVRGCPQLPHSSERLVPVLERIAACLYV